MSPPYQGRMDAARVVGHRRAIDAIPGMVWTARTDGHVDYVNQRWCDYTGVGSDDAIGAGWQAVARYARGMVVIAAVDDRSGTDDENEKSMESPSGSVAYRCTWCCMPTTAT